MVWSGVGAGLSGVVQCGSRIKWYGPVWEPGQLVWSGVGGGLVVGSGEGNGIRWCGPVWEPG